MPIVKLPRIRAKKRGRLRAGLAELSVRRGEAGASRPLVPTRRAQTPLLSGVDRPLRVCRMEAEDVERACSADVASPLRIDVAPLAVPTEALLELEPLYRAAP